MKKCFYLIAALLFATITDASAAPGDTTWVQANNRRFDNGNGYGNYDTAVTFPSGNVSYRKVYMIFTLGKYACPGYNPSNAGEGATQTGWCSDWDYDVHNIVMTPTDTFELGRLITPYANSNWPRTPLGFTFRYVYDVTDYYPILKNAATMRVFYSGYSAGFSGNIRFAFVEGTPERNVLGVSRVWHTSFDYGRATSINTLLTPLTKTAPTGTVSADLKMNITGHGGNSEPNQCAEFCPNTYTLSLNNNTFASQNFWKATCGANNLYPQSGTWTLNRANWCPGELVNDYRYKLNGIAANSNYTLGVTFPNYTSTEASYKIDGAVVYYGNYNTTVDAAIEDIIAPTNAEYHYRQNPMVGKPIITLHNSGSTTLTSVKFQYSVVGRASQTDTWTGSLAAGASTDVTLAELADLKLSNNTYNFTVKILEANGAADANALNNSQTSTFVSAPMWPSEFIIQFKNNSQGVQNSWKIEDMDGNVIREKSNCGANALCVDTVSLPFGKAYRLVGFGSVNYGYYDIASGTVVGSATGTGLYISGNDKGYIRAKRKDNGATIAIPAALTGAFEGMFGFSFAHYFYTGWPTAISNINANANIEMQAYPNPASTQLSVYISGLNNASGTVELIDMTGRIVLAQSYTNGIKLLDVSSVAGGVYQLVYKNAAQKDLHTTQRVVISK